MTIVEDLIEDFTGLDEREACQELDELGREIPEIPDSVKIDENLVPGCQSRVWVECHHNEDQTVHILADSDAFVVKGLIYVVLAMYQDRPPREILDVEYVQIFDRMGVGKLILPQRKNGLYSLVKTIRHFCAESLGEVARESEAIAAVPTWHAPTRSIENIAKEFPILQRPLPSGNRPVFLDSGASAQKPQVVLDKINEVQSEYYANAFRGKYYFGQRVDDEIEGTRAKVASLLNAKRTDEIVFTSGTTMSINMVAQSWGRKFLKPGDEVVITEMEHHANFVPWQAIAKERGAELKIIPVGEDNLLDSIENVVSDRTAIVSVCSMSNVLGTINPIEQIVQRAHAHDALVFVDAAQSIPHARIDVSGLDIDFLCFSGHKLYGPSGVGVLYGKRSLLQAMDPFMYGGHMIQTVGRSESTWSEPPAKFEAGTPPIVEIIGLGAALDFVASVGYEAIHKLEQQLLVAAHERLAKIPGLTIYGPDVEHKGAIVSFTVDGVSTEDLAMRLDEKDVFTRHGHHCAMVLHEKLGVPATTRASFGIYNTLEDVEALAAAIEYGIKSIR